MRSRTNHHCLRLLVIIFAAFVPRLTSGRSVEFSLTADWPTWELSPLQEAGVYLADELEGKGDASLLWRFIEKLEGSRNAIDQAIARPRFQVDQLDAVWALTLAQTSDLIPSLSHSLMHLYLGIRTYSPTLELHRSLRKGPAFDAALSQGLCRPESITWAVISPSHGQEETVVCSATALTEVLAKGTPLHTCGVDDSPEQCGATIEAREGINKNHRGLAFDYVYPGHLASDSEVVVTLYTAIGTSEFYEFHRLLAPQADSGHLKYVLRHFIPGTSEKTIPTALQGYGIYLDIKNMEYKNIDDSGSGGGDKDPQEKGDEEEVMKAEIPEEDEELAGLIFSKLLERKPQQAKELRKLRNNLIKEAESAVNTNMKVWRMRDLGLQTAQTIAKAKDPLRKLQDLSQNFPSDASWLSALKVTENIRAAASTALQLQILGMGRQPNPGMVFINGKVLAINGATFNIFDLIKAIRDEARLLQNLDQIQLPAASLHELLCIGAKPSTVDLSNVRIDIYRGSKGALFYLNNVQKDPQYQRYPRTLETLLYPSWQLHPIAKNLYTLTLVASLSEPAALRALGTMHDLYERNFPIRFSVVIVSRSSVQKAREDSSFIDSDLAFESIVSAKDDTPVISEVIAMLFTEIREQYDMSAAAHFLFALAQNQLPPTYAQTITAYSEAIAKVKGNWKTKSYVAEGWSAIRGKRGAEGARAMMRLVVDRGLPVGSYLMNGCLTKGLEIDQSIMQDLGREQQYLAQLVAAGIMSDRSKTILGPVTQGPHVYPRYHPILAEDLRARAKSVPIAGDEAESLLRQLVFLHTNDTAGSIKALTVILVADLGSRAGVGSLQTVLKSLVNEQMRSKNEKVRYAVLHSPRVESEKGAILSHLLRLPALREEGVSAQYLPPLENLVSFLAQQPENFSLAGPGGYDAFLEATSKQNEVLRGDATEAYTGSVEAGAEIASLGRRVLKVQAGEHVLIVNGRHIPLETAPLYPLDLDVIVQVESQAINPRLIELVDEHEKDATAASNLVLACTSFLTLYSQTGRVDVEAEIDRLRHMDADDLVLDLKTPGHKGGGGLLATTDSSSSAGDAVASSLAITVLLDPLTDTAQRISPFLSIIRDHLQLPLRLVLAPNPEISEFPLKSYYRFGVYATRETHILFQNLPPQHILTTRVDVPEPWNVQTRYALQDLDNLKCDATKCGDDETKQHTSAELMLKDLLLSGQCFDAVVRDAVNGLQLVLFDASASASSTSYHSDTLVMRTLAYFQLKANAGLWKIRLAEGRAKDLYELVEEKGGQITALPDQELVVAKLDFTNTFEKLPVRKRPGKEAIPLLDDISAVGTEASSSEGEAESSGMWSKVSKMFGSTTQGAAGGGGQIVANKNETVHVFSLATGHLYERMLKIMMLSVSKRTSVPVKFWLLENFLSPAFKTSANAMAEHYGFEVEFVTYKWPDWLRQQTEKQRIIWGYKILFLDVLFPLSVKKIIYVDADQVLRADLKELWDMDLKGHPYGYTPFCDSREETLGFQFWRQGYWKNHLQGQPYHISALYVVDLQRFRRMAVGDILRQVYDQLSRDPNSLSNLDQDLPNYTQNMVPIFSLPQDWLWCESWCSDESKATSKTIDLCNNPRFKEPKLDMAKRVISGPLFNESWVELDEEVKSIESKVGLVPA